MTAVDVPVRQPAQQPAPGARSRPRASGPRTVADDPPGAAGADRPPRRLPLPARFALGATLPIVAAQAAAIAVLAGSGMLRPEIAILVGVSGVVAAIPGSVFAWRAGARLRDRLVEISTGLQRLHDGDYRGGTAGSGGDEIGVIAGRMDRLAAATAARERRLMENALVDPLTGLHNRVLLTDRIRSAIATAQRSRGQFAVAVLDLDRFKIVNDTLGHATGDRLLKDVARRLKSVVRDSDTVARLGGDEFVLLLPGGADPAMEVAGRILEAMARPLRFGEQLIDIGVSIGIAVYPEHGQDDATLLRHADTAMYRAKHQRLGRVMFDGDSRELPRGYLSMLGEMRTALGEGQFLLHFQPQLDMRTGLIVGLEGLVRWQRPGRGLVPPGEFIPFAEQTGFMREITQWVVAEGARVAAELAASRLDLRVSVNVSAQDIENERFCSNVREIVLRHRLDPRRLCLEITESGVLSETETALRNLKMISDLGVLLSVDDFGTGYATLKQLQRLPVRELKIDRSFVTGLHANAGNQTIVRATIDLAKQLGLSVVAEGVETVKELRALAAMECDEVQGYFLSKPMPREEVVDWVRTRHALHESSREMYFEMLAGR